MKILSQIILDTLKYTTGPILPERVKQIVDKRMPDNRLQLDQIAQVMHSMRMEGHIFRDDQGYRLKLMKLHCNEKRQPGEVSAFQSNKKRNRFSKISERF